MRRVFIALVLAVLVTPVVAAEPSDGEPGRPSDTMVLVCKKLYPPHGSGCYLNQPFWQELDAVYDFVMDEVPNYPHCWRITTPGECFIP